MGPAASSSVDGPSGTRAGYLDHPGPATVTAPAKAAAVDLCLHLIHLDHGRHNRQRGRPSQTRARNRRQSGPHAGLRSPWGRTTTRRRLSPRQCCPRGTTCLGPAHRDPFQGRGPPCLRRRCVATASATQRAKPPAAMGRDSPSYRPGHEQPRHLKGQPGGSNTTGRRPRDTSMTPSLASTAIAR